MPHMPPTEIEIAEYDKFAQDMAEQFGCTEKPKDLIWHYTDGAGLLGILQSGSLHGTQIAALNDKNEAVLATSLYRQAITSLLQTVTAAEESSFLEWVLWAIEDNPEDPAHGSGLAYVCCFSGDRDELTQWERYGRKGKAHNWGYAIGFDEQLPGQGSTLFKVIYSRAKQEAAAEAVAEATLVYYLKGLKENPLRIPEQWREEFFPVWDGTIYPLAAAVKDAHWVRENEYRIYFNGRGADLRAFGFKQRDAMLSRHYILRPPLRENGKPGLLPIREIMIGPGNHPAFTKLNLQLLLRQLEYLEIPITHSSISLQNP
jgi:hypothetical protein